MLTALAAYVLARRNGQVVPLAALALPGALGAFIWVGGHVLGRPYEWRSLTVLVVLGLLALAVPRIEVELSGGPRCSRRRPPRSRRRAPDPSVWLAVHLTVAGALVTVTSLVHRDRRPVAWLGGLLLASATWVRLYDVGVQAPEAYTLPTARRPDPGRPGLAAARPGGRHCAALLPGLALATVPTLLWALVDPLSARAVVIGLVCLVLLVGGAALRWTAPVLVGWLAGAALVLRELAPYAQQTPQWVIIGVAGLVLSRRASPGRRGCVTCARRRRTSAACADTGADTWRWKTDGVLPRFEVVARRRPVRLVVPDGGPVRAPYVATWARQADELTLASGAVTVTAGYGEGVALHVTTDGRTTSHRSRRSGRPEAPVEAVALTLTGPQVTAFTQEAGVWVARARHDLTDRHDVHDEGWLAGLTASGDETGPFGQLGLRDLRVVSEADGSPYVRDGRVLLTATSAGPGGFTTGHCSVWSLDPETLELEHRADLFQRRGPTGGVYGDHAAHLVRDGDRWLLAASTWGDFDRHKRPVGVTIAESTARPDPRAARARQQAARPADGRLPVRRGLGPAPRAGRGRLAGRLRERDEVLPLPPRARRRPVARRADPPSGGARPPADRGHHARPRGR